MNGYAKQIAELLNISAEMAELVFDEMCASGFDFSESTKRQFVKEAKIAFVVVQSI
jgi:hypothetical protein